MKEKKRKNGRGGKENDLQSVEEKTRREEDGRREGEDTAYREERKEKGTGEGRLRLEKRFKKNRRE